LEDVIQDIDMVLIMSVNPGFGGQSFIPHTLEKLRQLRRMIDDKKLSTIIEVDGGITLDNAASIVQAGATALVAGSTVFKSPDPVATIAQLKQVG
jgi:ribulose-phosphate 3-epimerase